MDDWELAHRMVMRKRPDVMTISDMMTWLPDYRPGLRLVNTRYFDDMPDELQGTIAGLHNDLTYLTSLVKTKPDESQEPERDAAAIWQAVEDLIYYEFELDTEIGRVSHGTSPYGYAVPERCRLARDAARATVRRLLGLPEE